MQLLGFMRSDGWVVFSPPKKWLKPTHLNVEWPNNLTYSQKTVATRMQTEADMLGCFSVVYVYIKWLYFILYQNVLYVYLLIDDIWRQVLLYGKKCIPANTLHIFTLCIQAPPNAWNMHTCHLQHYILFQTYPQTYMKCMCWITDPNVNHWYQHSQESHFSPKIFHKKTTTHPSQSEDVGTLSRVP